MQKQKNLIMTWPALAVLVALGWAVESDKVNISFGFNEAEAGNRDGRIEIIEAQILRGQLSHLVLTHKDRLLRFGSELVFELCRLQGIRVTVIDQVEEASYEQQLSADVIELMTVFSARLYGRRSHQNRKAA